MDYCATRPAKHLSFCFAPTVKFFCCLVEQDSLCVTWSIVRTAGLYGRLLGSCFGSPIISDNFRVMDYIGDSYLVTRCALDPRNLHNITLWILAARSCCHLHQLAMNWWEFAKEPSSAGSWVWTSTALLNLYHCDSYRHRLNPNVDDKWLCSFRPS